MMTLKKYSKYVYYFSLSNLILFNYWLQSGIFSPNLNYYKFSKPSFEFFLGIILLFIITFFLNLILENIKRRKFYFLYNLITFIIALIVLNEIRRSSNIISFQILTINKYYFVLSFSIIIFLFLSFQNIIIKYFEKIIIFFSPFIIVVIFNMLNILYFDKWDNVNNIIEEKNFENKKSKIILIIFDELDYRVLKNQSLDNFKKILSHSDVYENAVPSADHTAVIIPSILSGKKLPNNENKFNFDLNEITIKYNGKKFLVSENKNLFNYFYNKQYKIGVIGAYHRYCNIFYKYLNNCFDLNNDEQKSIKNIGFIKYFQYWFLDVFPGSNNIKLLSKHNSNNFTNEQLPNLRIENIEKYFFLSESLIENNDFIFIHIPIPHWPWVYYNNKYNISKFNQLSKSSDGYYHNLDLANNYLGHIIKILNKKNLYNDSVVVLASDHGWREGDKLYKGSNMKKLIDRSGDVLLSIKHTDQLEKNVILDKTFNHQIFDILKMIK